eukprot:TRINITY_DN3783_c0_g2_i5.p2 TRINITY_DN3783_c0_g2~~TRINITY_DN3783_c0_g2_i5.p2  ORF type:complete len:161 (-),score=29.18 TRINITY_DN3783_c0_g2_i5:331-813(-)
MITKVVVAVVVVWLATVLLSCCLLQTADAASSPASVGVDPVQGDDGACQLYVSSTPPPTPLALANRCLTLVGALALARGAASASVSSITILLMRDVEHNGTGSLLQGQQVSDITIKGAPLTGEGGERGTVKLRCTQAVPCVEIYYGTTNFVNVYLLSVRG